MALSNMLTEAGFDPSELKTKATVTIVNNEEGIKITSSHLDLHAKIDGIENDKFEELANQAKEHCPVSAVLNCEISMDAVRSEEHTSELQSRGHLVCRLLLEKKKQKINLHNL